MQQQQQLSSRLDNGRRPRCHQLHGCRCVCSAATSTLPSRWRVYVHARGCLTLHTVSPGCRSCRRSTVACRGGVTNVAGFRLRCTVQPRRRQDGRGSVPRVWDSRGWRAQKTCPSIMSLSARNSRNLRVAPIRRGIDTAWITEHKLDEAMFWLGRVDINGLSTFPIHRRRRKLKCSKFANLSIYKCYKRTLLEKVTKKTKQMSKQ
jgi:hypothetical protein